MNSLLEAFHRYREAGIEDQVDYQKFRLYSIITHSTAIEGSTITELENQLLFDDGITVAGKSMLEQLMNLDLKKAYEYSMVAASQHQSITVEFLRQLSALVMCHTGSEYNTPLGSFSAAKGDLRLVNVSAGIGGRSYLSFQKVPSYLEQFCQQLNRQRESVDKSDIQSLYNLSFDAHYQLVTIHPWVDGNGRMSRLLMNHLQFEFNLVPTRIPTSDKKEYIQALEDTRGQENIEIFRNYMSDLQTRIMLEDIKQYQSSLEKEPILSTKLFDDLENDLEKISPNQQKILQLVVANPYITQQQLSQRVGISPKNIRLNMARLKSLGLLRRVGPDKGGHWVVKVKKQ